MFMDSRVETDADVNFLEPRSQIIQKRIFVCLKNSMIKHTSLMFLEKTWILFGLKGYVIQTEQRVYDKG